MTLLALIAVFSLVWTLWGLKLFFGLDNLLLNVLPHFPFGSDWGRGELGDFLGGGLTGATLLLLFHSLTVQTRQLSIQQADSHEAGVFRNFQALRSEVEGISVRIVSKYIKVKEENPRRGSWSSERLMLELENMSFPKMLEKYQKGDRTVFLRVIQKLAADGELQDIKSQLENVEEKKTVSDSHLYESLERFSKLMSLLDNSLEKDGDGDDFSDAIRSTEIFVTFKKLQRPCSKVKEGII